MKRYRKLANNVIVNSDDSIYFTPIFGASSLKCLPLIEEANVSFLIKDIEIQKSENVYFEAVLLTICVDAPETEKSFSVGIILSDFGNYISSLY